MDTLNLNNDAYSDREIEELFQLKPSYSLPELNKAKQTLLKQLGSYKNLGSEKHRELVFFIDTITNRLQNKNKPDVVIQQGNNFIIENPDRLIGRNAKIENGRITIDSKDVPPGYINPINVRTITQAISIDSRFRPNYSTTKSTNFDMVLPAIQKNVVAMRVATIELPLTYYAISKYNGNTTCTIIANNSANCWVLSLPDGNYEQSWANNSHAFFIETAMNDAIDKALPGTIDANGTVTLNPLGANLTATDFLFNLDRISGKAYFSLVAGGIFDPSGFTVRFNVDTNGNLNKDANIQLRLGWQLGFRLPEYTTTMPTIDFVLSEGICLICGPRYGFISIDDHQKNTGPAYMVAYNNSVLQDNIITRINLAELQSDVGVYQSSSDPGLNTQLNRTREYFGPVDIQRLHISIYDEYGRIIDLNYMDWSLTLAFEILYN
jgi:hypothetical protein